MKKLIIIDTTLITANLKVAARTIGKIFSTLMIMTWAVCVYFFNGWPDKYEIREYRQSYDGDMYDGQISDMIGWHSPMSEGQWWCMLVTGLIVILGGFVIYFKLEGPRTPSSQMPATA